MPAPTKEAKPKALFTVTAGVAAGVPEASYTRRWEYMDTDFEADTQLLRDAKKAGQETPPTRFDALKAQAMQYAQEQCNPILLNWVKVEWVWF